MKASFTCSMEYSTAFQKGLVWTGSVPDDGTDFGKIGRWCDLSFAIDMLMALFSSQVRCEYQIDSRIVKDQQGQIVSKF